MTTALTHPLVREYLLQLYRALGRLPAADQFEIFNQIKEHLIDAVAPDADNAEVAAVLAELGTPAEVAAAAAPPGSKPPKPPWRPRIRWRWAVTVVLAVAVIGTLTTVITLQRSAESLQCGCGAAYADEIDRTLGKSTFTFTGDDNSVPMRLGVAQGIVVSIGNPSRYTQTVVGLPDNATGIYQGLEVGTRGTDEIAGTDYLSDQLPIAIPPHQTRTIEIRLRPKDCESKGAGDVIDDVPLRVKVGWFTRDEDISLGDTRYGFIGDRNVACR